MKTLRLRQRLALPPSWHRRGEALYSKAQAWWTDHPPHERRLLAACGLLVLVALLWLVVLRPAWRTLDEAREQLPLLRSEMVQLRAVVREAQALQQGRAARVPVDEVTVALRDSLDRAGLAALVVLEEAGAGRWEAAVDDAPAIRLMDWLAELPFLVQTRTQSVWLERTRVNGRDRPGAVSGRITLTREEGER